MADIFDQISTGKSGDIFDSLAQEPSRPRSIASAPIKGLIRGSQGINPIAAPGPISQEMGERLLQQFLPTQNKGTEQILEKAGELAPIVAIGPEALAAKASQLAGGTLAGHLAKQNDAGPIGQAVAEGVGMSIPGIVKSAAKSISNAIRAPAEKFASGLTKPAAVEAKYAEKAIVSPERQQKAISTLNEEASRIAKTTAERDLPIIKKIEEGYDFDKNFQKKFESLRRMVNKSNPEINITPVSKILSQTAQKYRGIPKLHPEAQKVVGELKAFRERPKTDMADLLKIYRSNNQKMKSIFETSALTGKQKEYVDFLGDMNRAISKSFEDTLPKDSLWIKKFKENNLDYANYKRAMKTKDLLKPILGSEPTPAALQKLATDKKTFDKLKLAMGEKGAQDISQLSKDLKEATDSIKRIPVRKSKEWDTLIPLSIFIPHTYGIGTALSLKKGLEFAKRGYGLFLSSPKRRSLYSQVLKSIKNQDPSAYQKASAKLMQEVNNSQDI